MGHGHGHDNGYGERRHAGQYPSTLRPSSLGAEQQYQVRAIAWVGFHLGRFGRFFGEAFVRSSSTG